MLARLKLTSAQTIPPIYRLAVMHNHTDAPRLSFSSTFPGALNSPGAKACFYIFHMLPELISVAILYIPINARKVFDTGFWGDYRWRDDKATDDTQNQV